MCHVLSFYLSGVHFLSSVPQLHLVGSVRSKSQNFVDFFFGHVFKRGVSVKAC
jgi:hypothetical protein